MNIAIITGNLGRAPEVRYTTNGTPVATFSVATSERWKDKDGSQNDKTEWHTVVAWSKLAEICEQLLDKGSKVLILGRIQTREWEAKDGTKRKATEIVAREMELLSGGKDREDSGNGRHAATNYRQPDLPGERDKKPGYDEYDITDDDIPF